MAYARLREEGGEHQPASGHAVNRADGLSRHPEPVVSHEWLLLQDLVLQDNKSLPSGAHAGPAEVVLHSIVGALDKRGPPGLHRRVQHRCVEHGSQDMAVP